MGEGKDMSEMAHYCLDWARERRIMDANMGVTERRCYDKERRNAR